MLPPVAVVALAASLWGLDGLVRKPLATALAPATIVLWEHLIALAVLSPTVPAALRTLRRLSPRSVVAVVVIGVGASAGATALFTEAFALAGRHGDFITPLVLQKLQPVIAVGLAVLLLGERVRPRFGLYAAVALAGAWLLTFAQPWHTPVATAEAAALATGAAALWAAGTVLGRLVGIEAAPRELTTLRYVFGTIGAFGILWWTGSPAAPGWHNMLGLALLALVPGLLALRLYYVGLAGTPAARATFAELAFPATAAVVGVLFLGGRLTGSQWLGFAIVVAAVWALGRSDSIVRVAPAPTTPRGEPARPLR